METSQHIYEVPLDMVTNACYASLKQNRGSANERPVVNNSGSRKLNKRQKKVVTLIGVIVTAVVLIVMLCVTIAILQQMWEKKATESDMQWEEKINDLKMQVLSLKKENQDLKSHMEQLNLTCVCPDTTQTDLQNFGENFTKTSPTYPMDSCMSLLKSSLSGYYWVKSSNDSTIRVYCDTTRTCGPTTGGWTRVTSTDMKTASSQCPSTLCREGATCRLCLQNRDPGLHEVYNVDVSYSKVCGRVIGYQIGTPDAYSSRFTRNGGDGVFLFHGNPEINLWAFFAAVGETSVFESSLLCPCINPNDKNIPSVPSFFGSNYFCDTASRKHENKLIFYSDDPLWDGFGCEGVNECCSFNNPPWFYRELPAAISDDIKMRIQLDETEYTEDIAIEKIDIYVQ